ncbi:MAG: hypothetical protein L3J43_11275 [Sulfurovum sp.]|nr:hypothetical protein [Sulfurovum sp.]
MNILKYLIFSIAITVLMLFLTNTKPIDILKWFAEYSLKVQGLKMKTNNWKEFDLINISGETPAEIFGGLDTINPLGKYRIRSFYPYDGKVGFFGGSDYDEQDRMYIGSLKKGDKVDVYWSAKHSTAYLFKTNDDGQTFTKHSLGEGEVAEVIKFKENYYATVENYLHEAKTFVSTDQGQTWETFFHKSIELFFDSNQFIYSELTEIKSAHNPQRYKYFYTTDGGNTSLALSEKIFQYAIDMQENLNYRLRFNLYQGKLLFLNDEDLIFIDMKTQKEEITPLLLPKGYKIANKISRKYGENKYEFLVRTRGYRHNTNALRINPEDHRPYIMLQEKESSDKKPSQLSVWYPFDNIHIIFNKKLSQVIPFQISGNYVGGFVKKNGLLTHVWTLDQGKNWAYEILPDYSLLEGQRVMHNKIYMTAMVHGKRHDGKKDYPQIKGSFFIMATLKSKALEQ